MTKNQQLLKLKKFNDFELMLRKYDKLNKKLIDIYGRLRSTNLDNSKNGSYKFEGAEYKDDINMVCILLQTIINNYDEIYKYLFNWFFVKHPKVGSRQKYDDTFICFFFILKVEVEVANRIESLNSIVKRARKDNALCQLGQDEDLKDRIKKMNKGTILLQ